MYISFYLNNDWITAPSYDRFINGYPMVMLGLSHYQAIAVIATSANDIIIGRGTCYTGLEPLNKEKKQYRRTSLTRTP